MSAIAKVLRSYYKDYLYLYKWSPNKVNEWLVDMFEVRQMWKRGN